MSVKVTLDRLRALDLSKYPYFEAKELFRDLGQVGFIINTLHEMKVITRARSGSGYTNKSDLSYKPQKYNDKCQRASTPNNTMFYGTIVEEGRPIEETRLIAASECSSLLRGGIDTSGIEKITFGRWQVIKDIDLVSIVYKDIFSNVENNALLKELHGAYETFIKKSPDIEEKNNLIARFFAEEYSKENITNDFDYFLSAVFSEFVAYDLGYDGVMYPSVQAGGQIGFNVAVKPQAVDNKMKLDIICESTLYKNKDKSINITDKISSMETWIYLDSISNSQRDNDEILSNLGISSFDELNNQ